MKTLLIFLLPMLLVLCSCSSPRFVYAPSPPNNPYFVSKGESKLAACISGGPANGSSNSGLRAKNNGYDLQAAYAIADHWAITASYFKRKERDIYGRYLYNYFDSSIVNYERHIADVGGGYFVPLNRARTVTFNVYGGLGLGKFSLKDNGVDKDGMVYSRFHSTAVTKWYLQASLNSIASDCFRAAFVGRFSFVHYGKILTSYTQDEIRYFNFDRIDDKTIGFFEPGLNFQLGLPNCKWLKMEGNLGFVSNHPFSDLSSIEVRGFNASIGLNLDFSSLKE